MKQVQTIGIVLSRTNFGEADRIITVLTPAQGKLRLMAKGVRKIKSKLAGGIELFSVSDLTFIRGRGEIGTLVSSRLRSNFGNILNDINRVQLGYELIKLINKATEDELEAEYFSLLETALESLDEASVDIALIRTWFELQLLRLAGNSPNLKTDASGAELDIKAHYNFDFDSAAFAVNPGGNFQAAHIKTMRLLLSENHPAKLQKVKGLLTSVEDIAPLVRTLLTTHIRT